MRAKGAPLQVGRYEILRELGRGGMATVYLARQTDLDRLVALKELGGFYVSDHSFVERFLRESRVAGSLNHPNIVTVHEYFEHDGTPYIAMEYIEHGSLRPHIESLALPQAIGVLDQLLAGLGHAETRSIVHRDLKPENVMVTAEGTVKIADFGIAKAINQTAPGPMLTGTGTLLGTPDYMAPEQALAGAIGPWTDLYSLGVIAYEMMAGKVPFHETTTPMAILLKHVNEEIPPANVANPALDPRLSAWIERLLAKDPQQRIRRASDASDELEEIAIAILGPRWERASRLVGGSRAAETWHALTPPPFEDVVIPPAAGVAGTIPGATPVTPPPIDTPPPQEDAAAATVVPPRPAVELTHASSAERTLASPGPKAVAATPAPPLPPVSAPPSPPPAKRRRRGPLIIALVAVGIAGAVGAALAVTLGGGGSKEASDPATAQTAETVVTDVTGSATTEQSTEPATTAETTEPATTAPTGSSAPIGPDERLGVAVAGDSILVSDPAGWIAALDPASLAQAATTPDPASPRSVAASGSQVVVVDDETVTVYGADLTPTSAVNFGPDAQVATGGGTVAVMRPTGEARGRLCSLEDGKLDPCIDLSFRPSGLGVTTDGKRVLVASSTDGYIVQYRFEGGSLYGNAVSVAGEPGGPMVEFREKLYVPVADGVAVYDLASYTVTSTVSLGARPAAVWVAPSSGNLFAALPDTNEVAMVDTLSPDSEPTRVPVGKRPVALGGGDSGDVYVASAGDGSVTRLDALTGEVLGTERVRALRVGAPTPVTAAGIDMAESGRTVTTTIRLDGGRLPASGFLVGERDISAGRAVVELWQGGIGTNVQGDELGDLTVAIAAKPGRLVVTLTAPEGTYETFAARRGANGAIVLTVTEPAPTSTSSGDTSSGGSSGGGSDSGGGGGSDSGGGGITVG